MDRQVSRRGPAAADASRSFARHRTIRVAWQRQPVYVHGTVPGRILPSAVHAEFYPREHFVHGTNASVGIE